MALDLQLDFLQTKAPPLIGVDISSSSIKMVELSEAGKSQYRLEHYVVEPLPRDAVTDGNIANLDVVSDCVRRAWKRMSSRVKNAAVALPAAAVITKKIVAPAGLREEELELQVETEANQYIPFSLDEVNLDFQVLGPAPGDGGEIELLIAASRKEKVEDRVAAVEAAGLKAMVVDVETYATQTAADLMVRQLPGGARDRTVAIVDIGSTMMHINVLLNGESIYMREQTFGGNQLTQEIQRRYSLSSDEAEVAKRSGDLPENYGTEVLQPFMETMALEVARAMQFFFSSTQYNRIDHILLAGGCAGIPGLPQVVSARTQVDVRLANPFLGMAFGSGVKTRQLEQDAPSLLIACGLALRRFDPS